MAELKNKVQLSGNLGNKPDIRITDTGKKWARFSLATNETYRTTKGETVTSTHWHNLVAWGTMAEVAEQQLKKGMYVAVEGKLVSRTYVDKENVKRYVSEVHVTDIKILNEKVSRNEVVEQTS